jgi:cytochrome c553
MPEKASSHVAAMQQAAAGVSEAADLAAACTSAATMLGACGECHRAVGAMPAVAVRPVPAVGDTVGHMLNHQRATEQLMQGLVVPSSTAWNEGARALRTTPIARGKLPKDPKLTSELMEGEQRLHQLAERAASASMTADRAAIYGEMLVACAGCHSLHPNVWGPGKR